MRTLLALTALCAASLLAACGGGGGDADVVADTEVPGTAAQSTASYVGYAQALLQTLNETGEALSLAMVDAPPTSETDDPVDFD